MGGGGGGAGCDMYTAAAIHFVMLSWLSRVADWEMAECRLYGLVSRLRQWMCPDVSGALAVPAGISSANSGIGKLTGTLLQIP